MLQKSPNRFLFQQENRLNCFIFVAIQFIDVPPKPERRVILVAFSFVDKVTVKRKKFRQMQTY